MIQVKTFYAHNDLRNFSYLILDDASGESWVIDPYEAGPLIEYIKKNHLDLRGILNTHQHFDHIRGNVPLQETFQAAVKKLATQETIQLNQTHSLETLPTPGHTPEHQVFFISSEGQKHSLFSGDTLFNAGVGNCKNGGNLDDLFLTTEKLRELPGNIILYPGHDYILRNLDFAASIEPENGLIRAEIKAVQAEPVEQRRPRSLMEEWSVNPFFRLNSSEIRQRLTPQISLENEALTARDLFKKIRSLRDHW
jgi:hydroxyacylglutathione hydrolase